MNHFLSNPQKATLAILAREAYDYRCETMPFDKWRREQQVKACGKDSLRTATQKDYKKIEAHFLTLAGRHTEAMASALRAEEEERIQAISILEKELADRDLEIAYAEAICKTQYKTDTRHATAKQIWFLIYTVRNRRKQVKTVSHPYIPTNDLGDIEDAVFNPDDPF